MRALYPAIVGLALLAACGDDTGPITGADDLSVADLAGVDLRGADLTGLVTPQDLSMPGGMALPPGQQTLTIGGRSAIVYVPTGTAPMPLVIALHGNGDTNTNFVAALGLKAKADAAPFVLAAPQGVSSMPMGVPAMVDWDAYTALASNTDEALLDSIKAQLAASSTIDGKKIFVWGYSQGGYMAMKWGMDRADLLSCAGVIAASSPTGNALITGAPRKIPVAMQIGDMDGALAAARSTKTTLMSNGNPLDYHEIIGAGHVPFPGDPNVPLAYCLAQTLP